MCISSFILGTLTFAVATSLLILAQAMRADKLPPNSWAGIRTTAAHKSKSEWYRIQRAGSTPLTCLSIAYFDSSVLFVLQSVYCQVIPELVPVTLFSTQSLIGIIWIYQAIRIHSVTQTPDRMDAI